MSTKFATYIMQEIALFQMSYQEGYEDGYRQYEADRVSSRFVRFLFSTFFSILYSCFVYLPLLWCSIQIVSRLENIHGNSLLNKVGLILVFLYLIYCIIYFIKGIVIALKVNQKLLWIPFWIIAVLLTCGFQVSFLQYIFEGWLNPPTEPRAENYVLFSWIGALVGGIIIYGRYNFTKDSAPRFAFWAYSLGFKTSLKFVTNPIDSTPDRSKNLL